MDRDKIIERVAKLLSLAAPSSGTTQPERESAALEAALLIAEHSLILIGAPPKERKRKRPPTPSRTLSPEELSNLMAASWVCQRIWHAPKGQGWTKTTMKISAICIQCKLEIAIGEDAWQHEQHGFRHYEIMCAD